MNEVFRGYLIFWEVENIEINNLQIFKCEMDAGHSSKSGRTAAIEEVAFDYAFALKISGKLNTPLEN